MEPFVHLHVHSQYSILDGQASIDALVDKAIADGMPGIALTDHGVMYGVKEMFNYVNKKNGKLREQGLPEFKPIFGCEMYVTENGLETRLSGDKGNHLIVLAKNQQGYKNLCKLVSKAWTQGFYYHPRTDKKELAAYRDGLIVCSACLGGEIPKLILAGDMDKVEESLAWYKETFGDDYYLEMQRHKATVVNANHETYELQEKVNVKLVELSAKLGIKLIASNDVHFVNEEDAEAHDRLICVSTNKFVADNNRMFYSKQEWMKTTEEMNRLFGDIPESLSNTLEVLDKVETYSIDHGPIMPNFEIPA
ncbi:MAG: PHP domain-containing protein, partial [Muribaculaceae bacterium]|nr:PHP domain-containing protein [Muribaculaceae bacterium]